MRTTIISVICASALVAGCGSNGGSEEKGGTSAASGGAAVTMQAGQYETRVQVTKFEVPGLPEAQAQAMRQAMSQAAGQTVRHCLTPEQAARGPAAMAEQAAAGGQCTVDRYDVNGAEISGHITCNTPQGRLVQTMTGTVSGTGSEMKVEQEISASSFPQGKAEVELQISSNRTGECAAGAAQ